MSVRPSGSADEAVRAVRILQEVLCVAARISTAMLRQENAISHQPPSQTPNPFAGIQAAARQIHAPRPTVPIPSGGIADVLSAALKRPPGEDTAATQKLPNPRHKPQLKGSTCDLPGCKIAKAASSAKVRLSHS